MASSLETARSDLPRFNAGSGQRKAGESLHRLGRSEMLILPLLSELPAFLVYSFRSAAGERRVVQMSFSNGEE